MIIELTSADLAADPRLEDYTRLKDVKLRSKIEPERGLYMAESANVIERAIRAGHTPRSFLMSRRWLPTLMELIDAATGGGPVQSTTTLIYKIYREGFAGLDLSSSAAQSVILMLLVIGLTVIQFRFVERKVRYQ